MDARPDLVRSLLQSCYVIEHARANLQQAWGGDFERDTARTRQRAERLGRLLDERSIRRTDEVIDPHTAWFASFCGETPTEVILGAAIVHNFGKWPEAMARPFLGDDFDEFKALGAEHTRVETAVRMMNEDEAFLEAPELPSGKRFVILTDVHVGARGSDDLLRRAVADINALKPEFVVLPGDITDDGEPEQFRLAKEILDTLECPYYAVPGNHDAVQRSTREITCNRFWSETFGTEPDDHVVECDGLQVALVDSTDPTPTPFPDWDASGQVGGLGAGVDSGALRPGQAEELARRLDRSKPVLLIQHHELHPFPGFPPVKFAMREEDAEAELEALKNHKLVGIVAGHTHRSAALKVGSAGGVTQLEIPSLKDWPYTYSVATLTDDGVRVDVRQISDRPAVWSRAQKLFPFMRRFMLGGAWASPSYTFIE